MRSGFRGIGISRSSSSSSSSSSGRSGSSNSSYAGVFSFKCHVTDAAEADRRAFLVGREMVKQLAWTTTRAVMTVFKARGGA